MVRRLFSFPNPVWARVLTGPTLSPLGWTAQNVVDPRLGERKPVAGPPKRFARAWGCKIFGLLMRAGLIPDEVCAECADISLRLGGARPAQS